MKQFIVTSYDVVDNRRRAKVMKTLKNYGTRVQYSVFESRLEPEEFKRLQRALKRLISQQDRLRFYFIGADDVARIQVLGQGKVRDDPVAFIH